MEAVLRRGAERVEVDSSLVTTEVLRADLHPLSPPLFLELSM